MYIWTNLQKVRTKNTTTLFEEEQPLKYTFSGHDTFQCRQLWLKKGYDFLVKDKKSFNDDDAVILLGVGKNMVSSIRYWLKAFNIVDSKDIPTRFGHALFSDNGWDPFLEDEASVWLLHYQLVKTNLASIYNIIFNEFRKEKFTFEKESFCNYMKRRKETEANLYMNENTIADDFTVFTKMYSKNTSNTKEIEDFFQGILSEIELLKRLSNGKDEQYQIISNERDTLPAAIMLFSILENTTYGNSISLNSLEYETNSPGSIFALNRNGLVNKILEFVKDYPKNITYTDHAGIKELQLKTKPEPYTILNTYYGK